MRLVGEPFGMFVKPAIEEYWKSELHLYKVIPAGRFLIVAEFSEL